jgi:putative ATPase
MAAPLAERLRPKTLEAYIGQKHLIGDGAVLKRSIESGTLPSMIFWGPPGVGKTTLASIIAESTDRPFYTLSAINSGVKDVREVISKAEKQQFFGTNNPILFIDEIHRFSKSQQDSLLGAVEKGTITLIGATTENPSFEVISALLSRCQVYILKAFTKDDLIDLVKKAIATDEILNKLKIEVKEYEALLKFSGGDGRKLLNTVEIVVNSLQARGENIAITNAKVSEIIQQNPVQFDKGGEMHYDIASAFIKSMRGSDPNAAVYYLARMVEGGEDPKFIARRMLIFASEDIGLANPTAMVMANACFEAVAKIGYPECDIILSQTVIYLATSAKSNSAYKAIRSARRFVAETGNLPVPLDIRNAPTDLMKDIGYGKDYLYAHDHEGNFVDFEFLPEEIKGKTFYQPGNNSREQNIRDDQRKKWKTKYGY